MPIADVVKGFHDVTIVASNVAELRRFYAALGFRQVVDRGNELAVFLVGTNELAIHTAPTQPFSDKRRSLGSMSKAPHCCARV